MIAAVCSFDTSRKWLPFAIIESGCDLDFDFLLLFLFRFLLCLLRDRNESDNSVFSGAIKLIQKKTLKPPTNKQLKLIKRKKQQQDITCVWTITNVITTFISTIPVKIDIAVYICYITVSVSIQYSWDVNNAEMCHPGKSLKSENSDENQGSKTGVFSSAQFTKLLI